MRWDALGDKKELEIARVIAGDKLRASHPTIKMSLEIMRRLFNKEDLTTMYDGRGKRDFVTSSK